MNRAIVGRGADRHIDNEGAHDGFRHRAEPWQAHGVLDDDVVHFKLMLAELAGT